MFECFQDISLATYVGTSMAHEIGHNFNMVHDVTIADCQCDDPTGTCIMYPSEKYVEFVGLVSDARLMSNVFRVGNESFLALSYFSSIPSVSLHFGYSICIDRYNPKHTDIMQPSFSCEAFHFPRVTATAKVMTLIRRLKLSVSHFILWAGL